LRVEILTAGCPGAAAVARLILGAWLTAVVRAPTHRAEGLIHGPLWRGPRSCAGCCPPSST